jgi:hypothetical protein
MDKFIADEISELFPQSHSENTFGVLNEFEDLFIETNNQGKNIKFSTEVQLITILATINGNISI